MQSYYIKPKAFYDSFGDVKPSQPYIYAYGDRPVFEFSFLPNEIAEGDTLVFAIDNDMVFYDSTPENLLHSASCMVVVRHDVTAEEATAGKVQIRIETRTLKFRDVTNGKVRPVEVVSGLYRKRGSDNDINYVLLAMGRAFANGIIADYNALPEPITDDEYYTKGETNSLLDAKADKADLVAHTDDTTIHVTQQEKTKWSNKADRNDIGNATVTITQDGETRGSFSVNATDSVTIDLTGGGAQADWNETDTSSPSYIQNKPSVYTQTETNALLDAKADKATTLAGYGIGDAYTKTEVDAKVASVYHYKGTVSAYADLPASGQDVGDVWNVETADSSHSIKAGDNVAWTGTEWDVLAGTVDLTPYATKDELSAGLDGKSDIGHLHTGKYVPLNERGQVDGSYVVDGSWLFGGNIDTNGYVDALGGFKKNGVSLDNIYAPISHTHAMGDITGLPASGGTAGQVLTKTETGSEWDDLPDTTDYLCFTATQANSTVKLDRFGTPLTINLEYSVDKKTWTEYTWDGNNGATITLANIGDKVWWRGDNTAFSLNLNNAYRFAMTGSIEASGNVMSLLDKTCQSVTIPTEYCFCYLLSWNGALKTAPELPATKLANNCYSRMFYGCSYLTEAPELPATKLANNCYSRMFYGCSSLTEAPELPAITMVNGCYTEMFMDCSSLTEAPELPATTLAEYCYYGMFSGCTSLREAELPQRTPNSNASYPDYCYDIMFNGCTNLNKLKVNFTWWQTNLAQNWLNGASSTGVFECPSSLNCAERNNSRVPAGWTIVRTDSPKSITSPTMASSSTDLWIRPNIPYVPIVTVSNAITLNNGFEVASTAITYSEIVLDVASGATVTAGNNITLVDTPTAGKRNICVCRWSGGVCKLYVTIVEDLPA